MDNWRPRYWIPVADTLRVIVAVILAIIILILLLRACQTVTPTIVGPSTGAPSVSGQPMDLSGVAAPGATVRVFDGDTPIGETTADANGNWKLTLPAGLGAGTHELTARVFKDNAQVAGSTPLRLSVAALPTALVPTPAPPTPTSPPAPTATPPPTPQPQETETHLYVVKPGDSLSKIAKQFYGNANRWPEIYQANKDKIKNPNLIYPGQELRIP